MRILLDATSIDAGPSGARTRLANLLAEYAKLPRHHEVIVLSPRGRGVTTELAERGIECIESEPAPPPRIRWQRGPEFLDSIARDAGADVIEASTLPVPRTTLPLLLTIHDLRDIERPPFDPRAFYARAMLPRDLERVERVIAVSGDTADLLATRCRVPRDKISIVRNAPDPAVLRDTDGALRAALFLRFALPDRIVLALGHVEPRKNLELLVRAVRLLRNDSAARYRDIGIVCCGRDTVGEGDRLRALAARTPAVPLLFTGSLVPSARNALLALAECVCTPSKIEGFGMVPLEAMAAGVPVVVARARALPETVGDAAPLCDPDDPADLARHLASLLDDPVARAEWVRRGKEHAAKFTWRSAAEQLLEAHDLVAVAETSEPLRSFLPAPLPREDASRSDQPPEPGG